MRSSPQPFRSLSDYPAHRAHVGQPQRFDVAGASQFALLFLLGLRGHHRLLDFGCGSLRLGRLAIPYLDSGNYFGLEPDLSLVEAGFAEELGHDARVLKRPSFRQDDNFSAEVFGCKFDFIIAQSVFSHAGSGPLRTALASFRRSLEPGGLILANWLLGPEEPSLPLDTTSWVYPRCVPFMPDRIVAHADEAGLAIAACPWVHPGLNWFVLAASSEDLPDRTALTALKLGPPDWS